MKKIITLLLLMITFDALACPKYETRAVWVTTLYGLDWPKTKIRKVADIKQQQNELCQLLDKLKAANFNTILFQTRLRGNVIYPSKYESYNESLTGVQGKDPGYDPLLFAIDECHKRGMELHAWVVTIPVSNTTATQKNDKISLLKKHRELCKTYRGKWYLDPGHPGTKDYLTQIVNEIVDRYDIDGLHLDYIRYPEKPQHFPDQTTYRKYGKNKPLEAWRRDNINSIVRSIYYEVKRLKPWVKVSSSPVGKYKDTHRYQSRGWNAYHAVYQDAQAWMKEGIHDLLFPMIYFRDNDFYPFALDWNENRNQRLIVPGLGIYFMRKDERDWELNEIMRQINFVRQCHLEGHAYFRAQHLTDNTKGIMTELSDLYYRWPAFPSPARWLDSIPPLPPVQPSLSFQKDHMLLKWEDAPENENEQITFRIYASNQYPVDTENCRNIVCTGTRAREMSIPKGQIDCQYWAVTAADRYGNESAPLEMNCPSKPGLNIYRNEWPHIDENEILIVYNMNGEKVTQFNHQQTPKSIAPEKGIYRLVKVSKNKKHSQMGWFIP